MRGVSLLAGLLPALLLAAGPPPFEGNYEVWRNGKQIGQATTRQVPGMGGWRLENHSVGTEGSARLLGLEEHTTSTGRWHDGLPRPDHFRMQVTSHVKDIAWSADFDWPAGIVTLREGKNEMAPEVDAATQDPLSAGLRIRSGLMQGEEHWQFPLVDKDEIDDDEFRAFGEERIDTDLGCLVTRRVEKVRAPDSKRYTRTWYARDLGWAPVKMEHGKTGGNHMETRVLTLDLDGRPVSPGPACEAAVEAGAESASG